MSFQITGLIFNFPVLGQFFERSSGYDPRGMEERKYNCKILLYGEYTVLFGSPALAVPSDIFCGRWTTTNQSDQRLESFVQYLQSDAFLKEVLVLDEMRKDVLDGLVFDSNIPIGYGMGSSGALTAAVYDRYARDPVKDTGELRKILSMMEAFFHGQSSGIDPLVSYLDLPIIQTGKGLQKLDRMDEPIMRNIFLLDSGQSRSTSKLVARFRDRLEESAVRKIVENVWSPLVTEAIEAHLEGRSDVLQEIIKKIQLIIWETFPEFIPGSHHDIWQASLDDINMAVKLCGAGGGGMTLGFGNAPKNEKPLYLSQ